MDDFLMSYSVEEYYDDEIAEYLYNREKNKLPSRVRTRYEYIEDCNYNSNDDSDIRDYYGNGYED